MSTARDIAFALAGRRAQRLPDGDYLVPCPVPSHGKGRGDRNPSLRLADGEVRLLVRCYAGCDRRAVLDELRRRGLLDDHGQRNCDRRPVETQNGERRKPEGNNGGESAARARRAHRRGRADVGADRLRRACRAGREQRAKFLEPT